MVYYAVPKGYKSGVYSSWDECKQQVNGYSGPVFKKFSSMEEANNFMRSNGANEVSTSKVVHNNRYRQAERHRSANKSSGSSSSQNTHYNASVYGASSGSSSSYKPTSNYNPPVYGGSSAPKSAPSVKIFTDGASRGNGKANAVAGYGVYYGENDERNAAVPLLSGKPTNQRAELMAASHALDSIHKELKENGKLDHKYEIHTDSMYTKNTYTSWLHGHKSRDWNTAAGTPVVNRDIIEPKVSVLADINKEYEKNQWGPLEFVHVKGHAGNFGNDRADQLANLGADKAAKETRK